MKTFSPSLATLAVRATLFAALAGTGTSALAQDADAAVGAASTLAEPADDTLAVVTVTARRREEDVQDVPIPIAALDGQSLERAGQFRLEDLNQRLPSTNVLITNPRQMSFAVRGLGNNVANDALESSVGTYLDNVYLGRPGMANFDLIDLDQIALLRGPQGTLFGKNTTAGVLNIQTRAPSFDPSAAFETTGGNDGYWQVRGAVTGPLSEHLAGRLSASKTYRDGYIEQPLRDNELNESNRTGVRGQLAWNPSEALNVRFIADWNKDESDCCAGVIKSLGANDGATYLARVAATGAIYQFDPDYRTVWTNGWQHMSVDQGGASVEANWKLDSGTLTSISAYRYWDFKPYNDADGVSLNAIVNAAQQVNDEQVSQEIRWASPTEGAVEYVAGFYGFYQAQDNKLFTQYGPDAGIWFSRPQFVNGYTQTNQDLHTRSWSLFGQATWKATDAFSLTAGVRGTRERKNTVVDRLAPTGPNPGIAALLPAYYSGDLEIEDTNVSGLLSAAYKLTDDVLLYGSVSRGVKSGGVNPSVPPTVAGGLPASETLFIEPEIALDYELGVKTELFERRLQLNANLFWTDVDDYQAARLGNFTGTGISTQILGNIGSVRTRGVELEIASVPVEGLTVQLTASYNDAKYTDYKNGPCAAEKPAALSCDLTGERVYLTPEYVVNPNVNFERKFERLTVFTNVGYSWRSNFYGSADSSELAKVDGYGLLNARIGVGGDLRDTHWSASLWANNALDDIYFQSLSRGSYGEYAGTRGLPRTYGLTLRVDF
ncbi:MAG TPA: TonB-dependent receptor [Steroidobacteraceae bacterium]|nr:TonB-dependent receptor [Steroidobacteraceae bacterium]